VLDLLTLSPTERSLHLAAALAHTAPGVRLRLHDVYGEHIHVGYGRIGPHLTPCQLRSALIRAERSGADRFATTIAGVEVAAGIDHLGGGLYARGTGAGGGERWFATGLPHETIVTIAATHPDAVSEKLCAVHVIPDPDLGVSTVRVVAADQLGARFDELAYWLLSQCLVAELLASIAHTRDHSG
jgi:hypothetical protein